MEIACTWSKAGVDARDEVVEIAHSFPCHNLSEVEKMLQKQRSFIHRMASVSL